jgi:hypothetical protein
VDVSTSERPEVGMHFPQFRLASDGGPEAYMEAGMGGVLQARGRCLGFASHDGANFATIIWPPDASLGADAGGVFVAYDQQRFRIGEALRGGGGSLPADFSGWAMTRPFPDECDRRHAIQFHSFGREDRAASPPPPQPAPPPAVDPSTSNVRKGPA